MKTGRQLSAVKNTTLEGSPCTMPLRPGELDEWRVWFGLVS
jgi:hypothetical protein